MAEIDKKLFQGIKELEDINFFRNEFVIFGAGYCAEILYDALKYRGYHPVAVIDNSKSKAGRLFHEYSIKYAPDYIKERNCVKYLAFSTHYSSIKEQMLNEGMIENEDFFPIAIIQDNRIESEQSQFDSRMNSLSRGKLVYDKIRKEYGEECTLFVNPAVSIGDVYLMNYYISDYKNRDDALFVFGTRTLYRLALFSNIKNSVYITINNLCDLLVFSEVAGFDNTKVFMLHTGFVHYRIWSRMLTLKKITWMEHYRELFGLENYYPDITMPIEYARDVSLFFDRNSLVPGKTVILSPYANTIRQMSLFEWDKLVEKLKDNGWVVCTNIGSSSEIPIHNTIPLHIDIEDFPAVVEKAGCFIGTRSGLCDFLVGNKAKKVVFFTKEIFDLIKVKDFYSLIKVGDPNTLEIECDCISEDIIENICLYLGSDR